VALYRCSIIWEMMSSLFPSIGLFLCALFSFHPQFKQNCGTVWGLLQITRDFRFVFINVVPVSSWLFISSPVWTELQHSFEVLSRLVFFSVYKAKHPRRCSGKKHPWSCCNNKST
jgi:hypothetical protein